MSGLIESVSAVSSHRRLLPKAALRLAEDAIAECLERAHRKPEELDLLINAGLYRERNLAEPALAAMIQEDIGANTREAPHATFSFDVANGGAGVITALELVCGFIDSRTIEHGVVVASDSDPGMGGTFPFPNAGGAILLAPAPLGAGFLFFHAHSFPEFAGSFEATIEWRAKPGLHVWSAEGENALGIRERPEFAAQAAVCAATVAGQLLERAGLAARQVDLLVASAYPRQFAHELARLLELPAERVALPEPALAGAHTAGLIGALEPAFRSGRLAAARNTLLVAAGAGITAAAALYRHRPAPSVA